MKQTFTREEVEKLIHTAHEWDLKYPLAKYRDDIGLPDEQVVDMVTEQFMDKYVNEENN